MRPWRAFAHRDTGAWACAVWYGPSRRPFPARGRKCKTDHLGAFRKAPRSVCRAYRPRFRARSRAALAFPLRPTLPQKTPRQHAQQQARRAHALYGRGPYLRAWRAHGGGSRGSGAYAGHLEWSIDTAHIARYRTCAEGIVSGALPARELRQRGMVFKETAFEDIAYNLSKGKKADSLRFESHTRQQVGLALLTMKFAGEKSPRG